MIELEQLRDLVNADAALVRRGRYLSTSFLVEVGDTPWVVTVREGRIERVERGPFLMKSWSFAIRASEDAWRRFWAPTPKPGDHDLFAMVRHRVARIEGDIHPFMANLRYVKDVLAAPRRLAAGGGTASERRAQPPAEAGTIEPIVGRYVHVRVEGTPLRIYYEEAGQGIPLVCVHTAGSDGRQFRHLMNDPEITRHWRVIAFDMPWHGKSTPPPGWQDEEYRLTSARYVATILAFVAALALDRPVLLGCSIGGRIVLHLALEHADRFGAMIGLESAAHQQPWYDDTSWLNRADVHGGEACAALVSGLTGPESPAETRWETLWTYAISGPGVFAGDLYFYRREPDLRARVPAIDTSRCPLYLLTGDYDFSCTPDDTRATADAIPGAHLTIMRGLGHFPMSEDPARFREYIVPVLDEIRKTRATA